MNTTESAALLTQCRDMSQLCWEQAANDPRDESSAAEFIAAWDAAQTGYDVAIVAIAEGRIPDAIDVLTETARLEREYGDDQHARRALAAVQS